MASLPDQSLATVRPVAVQNKLLASRYEYKYVITEQQARMIHAFIQAYLKPDQFTPPGYTNGYAVHSLYLDSVDLHTCMATRAGEKNRFKLRVRFYDENPDHPVFFEIKRRNNAVILKQRATVRREYADELVQGAAPRTEHLVKPDYKNWCALFEFCHLRDALIARPAAYTSYMRAGYEPPDNNAVRVTFDREIRAGRFAGTLSAVNVDEWPMIPVPGVVLELKFTDRFPNWMCELTQIFELQRGSMPKYVECMSLLQDVP
jgi:hypothetical protein